VFFVRRLGQKWYLGPYSQNELQRLISAGEITDLDEAVPAKGQSTFALRRSDEWRPIRDVLLEIGLPTTDLRHVPVVQSHSTSRLLATVRGRSNYPFLRKVNDVVFWLHCVLIVLSVLLCLFGLGWSESLSFWSVLFLIALTGEAVVVALVIRGAAEMAVDVADCVAEQTRLAAEAHKRATHTATPSPPPTPPYGL
jgi:hypothetical protein